MTPKKTTTTISSSSSSYPSFWYDATLPWAVDMDGTLIRQDVTMLAYETSYKCWRYWPHFALAVLLLACGARVPACRFLERHVPVSPARLTYHLPLLRALQRHRAAGGVAILATASHVHIGRRVADHVRQQHDVATTTTSDSYPPFSFDDVLGSRPPRRNFWNLEGATKAFHVAARFPKGFVYAGNEIKDVQVWRHPACRACVLVNCAPNVIEQVKALGKPYVVLE